MTKYQDSRANGCAAVAATAATAMVAACDTSYLQLCLHLLQLLLTRGLEGGRIFF